MVTAKLESLARQAGPVSPESSSGVTFVVTGSAAVVTLGSGRRRNALAPADWQQLERTAEQLAMLGDLKVVVLRGAALTFSAGSDLRYWDGEGSRRVDDHFALMEAAIQAIERIPVPTIAVVEGVAAGAGCELALACDLRIFGESAKIGLPILQLGVLVSPHFAFRLTSLVGVSRSRELLYTGRLVSAAEADRLGMANMVIPDEQVSTELQSWVENISRQPRSGLVAAKAASSVALRLMREQHDSPGWSYADPDEFRARIQAFLGR